jgi:hypothetical protein
MAPVDFVAVGHMTYDLQPQGRMAGGTALYAATTAARLGRSAAIISAGPSDDQRSLDPTIHLAQTASPDRSTFEHSIRNGRRAQRLHAIAARIDLCSAPADWLAAPLVLLGPVLAEFDLDLLDAFPNALIAVTPQGWMRRWEPPLPAAIRPTRWLPPPEQLRRINLLVLSSEDIAGNEDQVLYYARHCPLVVVTHNRQGATLYHNGQTTQIDAFPAAEHDSTGAGDVFAAALLIALEESGDPYQAAGFAAAVAACSIEGPGISAIPDRPTALARMNNRRA